jgi:hypothetical protein
MMAKFQQLLGVILIAFLVSEHSAQLLTGQLGGYGKTPVKTTDGTESEHIDYVLLRLHHLDRQIPSDIVNLRILLKNELESNPIYEQTWGNATEMFQQRKADLVHPGFELIPDEYHIALIAYTMSDTPANMTPLYSDFNKKTRDLCRETENKNYPYKSLFKLLSLAIESLSKDPQFQMDKPAYYRGASFQFALTEGQVIAFQSFTSTSIDMGKAIEYSRNVTFFEFQGPIPHSIYVKHHSKFPEEEEVLVSPFVTYKVDKIILPGQNAYTQFNLVPTLKVL